MADLSDIIDKIESGPAGRYLDWLVAEALGIIPEHRVLETGWDYEWYRHPGTFALWKAKDSEGRSTELWQAPQVTTSIDAAVALAERVLPNQWRWIMDATPLTDAAGFPLAYVLTTLRALQQKGSSNG